MCTLELYGLSSVAGTRLLCISANALINPCPVTKTTAGSFFLYIIDALRVLYRVL